MSLYVDTSALLKRYVAEDESERCEQILLGDLAWVTARHTWVEVVRNLARLLAGAERARVKKIFRSDWERMHVVEVDATVSERAGDLARPGVASRVPAGSRTTTRRRATAWERKELRVCERV